MQRISKILVCILCVSTAVVADEADGLFQGEWRTTIGLVKLKQKANCVTGTYGPGDQFPLKGTVSFEVPGDRRKGLCVAPLSQRKAMA